MSGGGGARPDERCRRGGAASKVVAGTPRRGVVLRAGGVWVLLGLVKAAADADVAAAAAVFSVMALAHVRQVPAHTHTQRKDNEC